MKRCKFNVNHKNLTKKSHIIEAIKLLKKIINKNKKTGSLNISFKSWNYNTNRNNM